jgi:ferredoxin-NADP reductase
MTSMIATEYKTQLKHKEKCGDGAMAFYFDKPAGFEFAAGQYIDLTLVNPPETDPDGSIRSFSLASAPAEEHLLIVTRMRDTAFKRSLQQLAVRSEVEMDGPFGAFRVHASRCRPAIFLAGGIGIAPISSMIRDATLNSPQTPLYLFYSNKNPERSVFLDALQEFEKKALNFRFIPTMTAGDGSCGTWSGETGSIDLAMLSKYLPGFDGAIFYLAGSPRFVDAMQKMLKLAGVNEEQVRVEEFVGY